MKTISKKIIRYLGVATIGILLTASCKDYLNVAPEVQLSDKDVFGSFLKYQGFVEDLYQCVVDVCLPNTGTAENNWNFGLDEGIMTSASMLMYQFEIGNYWSWQGTSYSPFMGSTGTPSNSSTKGYWRNGWWGIRKANEAMQNIDILRNGTGTDEEVNLILGQAYFFRAYLHYEILRHWGHIPYIDSVYNATDVVQPAPLTYAECAARIDEDLRTALDYLPVSWDETVVGQERTSGNNAIRVNKGAAWAIIGMNALYAGSPLMATDATSPNAPDSTHFDIPWMTKAAEAYGNILMLSRLPITGATGTGGYDLLEWKEYQNNFRNNLNYTGNYKETVWSYPNFSYFRWRYGDAFFQQLGAWGVYLGPTQNYVENFGMANGLPLADPASGYDPANPWVNRDPRFDYNIIVDHDRRILNPTSSTAIYTYADLFIGGWTRSSNNSLSGYGYKKYTQVAWNSVDNQWGNNKNIYYCPQVRLAGVLLEYAEAVNEAYGPDGQAPNCPLTAVQAVNMVRSRVRVGPYNATGTTHSDTYGQKYDFVEGGTPLPNVSSTYTGDKATFRQIIRNERAVELAYENKRWDDMRRWGIASNIKWREKYELQFDAAHTFFNKVLYATSIFEPKHWWLPFPTAQVNLYPEFKQNPGW